MICWKCNSQILEDAIFCDNCGAEQNKIIKCRKCGAELLNNPSFCKRCGTPTTTDSSAGSARVSSESYVPGKPVSEKKLTTKATAKKSSKSTLISVGIAVVLALALLSTNMLWLSGTFSKSTDTDTNMSFSTPEDTIDYFAKCISSEDSEGALQAFAISEKANGYDAELYLEQYSYFVYMLHPSANSIYIPLNESNLAGSAATQIVSLINSIILPEEFSTAASIGKKDLTLGISGTVEVMTDTSKLENLTLVRADAVEVYPVDERVALYGADRGAEYVMLYELDGEYYQGGAMLLEYNGSWKIESLMYLSGFSGSLLKTTKADYLDWIDEYSSADSSNPDGTDSSNSNNTADTTAAATTAATTKAANDIYIPVISKGLQHQFWQVVKKGADDAAAKYGITITFEGPASESEIAAQVTMLDSAIAKKPSAICLAALSTDSVTDQLNKCLASNIPVIGFDSGVPGAPEGSIYANASTDNNAAGALAATSMFPAIEAQVKAATVAAPVRITVLSQDATSESVKGRTKGYIDKMLELVKGAGITDVAVVGHDMYKNDVAEKSAAVIIDVAVSATTAAADLAASGSALLNKSPISIYGSNESAANGILDATNEGADLGAIVAVGFDAGIRQKTAVAAGYFLGSITQDPYNIGYQAVELAYKAVMGESVANVDTGAKFYTAANMYDADIQDLIYD